MPSVGASAGDGGRVRRSDEVVRTVGAGASAGALAPRWVESTRRAARPPALQLQPTPGPSRGQPNEETQHDRTGHPGRAAGPAWPNCTPRRRNGHTKRATRRMTWRRRPSEPWRPFALCRRRFSKSGNGSFTGNATGNDVRAGAGPADRPRRPLPNGHVVGMSPRTMKVGAFMATWSIPDVAA